MKFGFFIRLDDSCETMNFYKWQRVLSLLDKYKVKPIIAVIPNNKDKNLMVDPPIKNFWELVRKWKSKGYLIAMHGCNHIFDSKSSGLVPLNCYSEFAGHPFLVQKKKLEEAYSIFNNNNIEPDCWVAPAHSFDKLTLKALKEVTNIKVISDGIAKYPFRKYDFDWLPQQLWSPKYGNNGVWTICYHPDNMSDNDFKKLEDFLKENNKYSLSIDMIEFNNTFNNKVSNIIYKIIFFSKFKLLQFYSMIKSK